MFCPSCGSDQRGQYCRSCGADLRGVRSALERPDAIAASAVSARDEIGRAVADKIRELKSVKELSKVVEDVLPEIAKFLESPEEKRLRSIRSGMIMTAIGLGAAICFFAIAAATSEEGLLFPAGAGLVLFLIGLGMMINGWYFTVPKKQTVEQPAPMPVALESLLTPAAPKNQVPMSVTDHTTHQLQFPDQPIRGKANLE